MPMWVIQSLLSKRSRPKGSVKGDVIKAVIVRTRLYPPQGWINDRFYDNSCVLVDDKQNPRALAYLDLLLGKCEIKDLSKLVHLLLSNSKEERYK